LGINLLSVFNVLHTPLQRSKPVIPVLQAFLLFVCSPKNKLPVFTWEKLPAERFKYSVDQVFKQCSFLVYFF